MTHTPGPWRTCYSDELGSGNIRSDHHQDGTGALLLLTGPMFHDYTPAREEELANLRLAAASPDLLLALKAVVDLWENGSDGWSARDFSIHEANVLGDAEAAIVKAEEVKP